MNIIIGLLFWYALAVVFAGLEIEAEGKYGWAEKMPTWYRTHGVAAKIYGMLMGGKPLTGYHAWMFVMPLFVVHAGFILGAPWSIGREVSMFALFFAWAVLWDFIWFVLNPEYGVKNFRKTKVWWHAKSKWIFGLFPHDYLVGWVISVAVAYAAERLGAKGAFEDHLLMLAGFLVLTALTIFVAPDFHAWKRRMHARDDRPSAPIFHD